LLDGNPYSVVGVMPAGFTSPPDARGVTDEALLWVPLARFASAGMRDNRSFSFINPVVARLGPGVSAGQAAAEMRAIATELERLFPDHNRGRGMELVSLDDTFFGRIRRLLLVLFGAVGFVLLIACVNVASLLAVRGAARQRELALRTALGAKRGRLVRMLLTESVLLSLGGGALGLLLASSLIDALLALSPLATRRGGVPARRRVVIVSQRFLERSQSRSVAGGRPGLLREGDRVHEIVGVVADVQHLRLLEPSTVASSHTPSRSNNGSSGFAWRSASRTMVLSLVLRGALQIISPVSSVEPSRRSD